ncbi:AAA family ATPase [Polyangium mundeleinium]|uniref:AAA family ATPase n=1 Tax=Polyangium mundeleinium TaxID=2995306 RepID=A0ABT5ET03_9BACT|nr:AAA family ATPase [Polyangium mundeleinium]MDC0744947.1 AAA family ATPase [Polyangium mundeleinium]
MSLFLATEETTADVKGFEITSKIGEGVRYVTYRGRRLGDGQDVAVKVMAADSNRLADIARLKHTYGILQRIDSDKIVKVHGVEEQRDGLAVITEYFPGTSLASLLARQGTLDIDAFLRLGISLAEALADLHRRGLVHGDTRPENILLGAENQIKLTGFGVDGVVTREKEEIYSRRVLSELLPYSSPEQTNRMNRSVDYRTDMYSLGVVFYEMLVGRRPFEAEDPLELIHAHLAASPPSPSEARPEVPEALSAIVLKLLRKGAEDRYSSAEGLQADLSECQRQWQTTGQIEPFVLGQHDRSDLLQIHQGLYGREKDIRKLIESFDDVLRGRRAIILVSGYSGIGKSSLVQEILKPLAREKGYYISGKYDQYIRDTPYSAVIQAFDALLKQLLCESEERLAAWREAILGALGSNGQVLCDFLPSLKHIIGEQPPVPALGPVEAQNRVNLYFRKFVSVFARPAHPLAIFLDDLQWVDAASLSLITSILADEDRSALFFCGAYRDNEVSPTHAFMVALEELEQGGTEVVDIVLEPLDIASLSALINDSLGVDDGDALAAVVLRKTGGNPFFVKRFLRHLYEAKVLFRDPAAGWRWDLSAIERLDSSDNVLGLMAETLLRLPPRTQDVLRQASAIGNVLDLEVLYAISATPPDETYASLEEAIREGLIVTAGEQLRFAHDKIQEAAYSLIPVADRAAYHYRIGEILLLKLDPNKGQDLFDIVNHLNNAGDLITAPGARLESARLNLKVAERAEESGAFSAALKYLEHGAAMLPRDAWSAEYELSFAYHTKKGVLESLCERHDDALATLAACFKEAKGRVHQTAVRRLIMNVQILKNDLLAALDEGLAALRAFGIDLPPFPDADALAAERARTFAMIGDRPVASLIDLPPQNDPEIAALQDLLQEMFTPCYQLGTNNLAITIMKMLQNTLTHGISRNSIFAYMNFGTVLCASMDIEKGYEFGRAAVRLNEIHPDKKSEAMLANMWAAWVQHWKEGYTTYKATLRRGMHTGVETGQYIWAFYNTANASTNSLLQGRHLQEILEEARQYQPLCKLDKFNAMTWMVSAIAEVCEDLSRPAEADASSRVAWVDIDVIKADARKINNTASLYFANVYDVLGGVFKGAYEEVAAMWGATDPAGDVMLPAWHATPCFYFYGGVAFARASTTAPPDLRELYLARFYDCARRMAVWSELNPESLRHRHLLLQAELARIEPSERAGHLYDEAIAAAREGGFAHDEALGNELCARHYLDRGRSFLARVYLAEAHRAYARWGAVRVMERLEKEFSHVLRPEAGLGRIERVADGDPAARKLDLGAVVKASQAISGEILIPQLLQKLMHVLLESAGARKGFVILRENERLVIRAEGHIDQAEIRVLPSAPLESRRDLATCVVKYVARTAESVVLHEGAKNSPFADDPYIEQSQLRSLLATPILRQGRLVGVLYLENELAGSVFTPDRMEMLRLLSAQVAISIENALLYSSLEENVRARTREIEQANARILSLNAEQQRRQEMELSQKQALIAQQKELIRVLSTPILEVWDGVLTIPIVGVIDEERSSVITQNLLARVVETQSKFAIVDLTGVDEMDPGTAEHIVRIIGAVRLLGARSVITGIQPAVARAMISLGVDLSRIQTRANLRDGLRTCLNLGRGKDS